jgi:hypothetical protein
LLRPSDGGHVIVKIFFLTKEFRAIRAKSLRDKKSFRDHGPMPLSLRWSQQAVYGASERKSLVAAMITKVLCTYKIRILRRKKSLRDHGDGLGRSL